MKYYLLNFIPPSDNNYCFCKAIPDGNYFPSHYLTEGTEIAENYPEDPFSVVLPLDDDWPAVRLGSFVGNSGRLLIFHKEVADNIQKSFNVGKVEIFLFTILNHKARIHSKDYVFFNPIGSFDCIDEKKSKLDRDDDGTVFFIEELVLNSKKLKEAPDLFRILEQPNAVLFSQNLVNWIEEQGYTNFDFSEVDQNDS